MVELTNKLGALDDVQCWCIFKMCEIYSAWVKLMSQALECKVQFYEFDLLSNSKVYECKSIKI
jgi:hypothetical protein